MYANLKTGPLLPPFTKYVIPLSSRYGSRPYLWFMNLQSFNFYTCFMDASDFCRKSLAGKNLCSSREMCLHLILSGDAIDLYGLKLIHFEKPKYSLHVGSGQRATWRFDAEYGACKVVTVAIVSYNQGFSGRLMIYANDVRTEASAALFVDSDGAVYLLLLQYIFLVPILIEMPYVAIVNQ